MTTIPADELACDHAIQRVVKYRTANGSYQVIKQCVRCGAKTTSALPHRDYDLDALPEFDRALRDEWWQAELSRRQQARNEARAEARQTFFANEDEYLKSDHWRQLRRRVLVRDGFRCQNCFCKVTDATAQVHHLHGVGYEGLRRVGHSFAFECVTLCRMCHEDYHPHMTEEQPEWAMEVNGHV
jgi:5-methylcytosine-specific restriction endonuclease McrA